MLEVLSAMSIQIVGLCVTTLRHLIGGYHVAEHKKSWKLIHVLAGIRTFERVQE
jgi:hypothetical protein